MYCKGGGYGYVVRRVAKGDDFVSSSDFVRNVVMKEEEEEEEEEEKRRPKEEV